MELAQNNNVQIISGDLKKSSLLGQRSSEFIAVAHQGGIRVFEIHQSSNPPDVSYADKGTMSRGDFDDRYRTSQSQNVAAPQGVNALIQKVTSHLDKETMDASNYLNSRPTLGVPELTDQSQEVVNKVFKGAITPLIPIRSMSSLDHSDLASIKNALSQAEVAVCDPTQATTPIAHAQGKTLQQGRGA
ncbi:MAG: hypothetical protein EAZ74_01680 [Alphaproteobacteria bacterium]|nr:MAG: hypothetical protein EAY76_06025 [Alphaproteobacteria bacterium]TAF15504.1 MAG: hypothetical protein EAZ74_01680 [Alphaproteobacteria bacterium]TAF40955.1 MAG: hypothetical protein EAZ66_02120 [Alphaproteobacteria bacterium]